LNIGLSFRRSNGQKQSINDASQYVVVPPIAHAAWVKTVAKIRFFSEYSYLLYDFFRISTIPRFIAA
jgi:hypothetical protein